MKIKAVLFDFDGTVIDTMEKYANAAASILSEEAKIEAEVVKKLYLSTAGMDFPSQLLKMNIDSNLIEKIYHKFIEEKKKILEGEKISPYALELLRELKKRGKIVAVSTNNECGLVEKIAGIEDFDEVLCFDGRDFRKGEKHLNALLSKYGLKKDEVVFVGDSDYDIITYGKLGIRCLKTRGIFDEEEEEKILEELSGEDC